MFETALFATPREAAPYALRGARSPYSLPQREASPTRYCAPKHPLLATRYFPITPSTSARSRP